MTKILSFERCDSKGAKKCTTLVVDLVDLEKYSMLKNEPAVAIIGVDTAENKTAKVPPKWGVPNGSGRGHRTCTSHPC